jgi:hypothetical protein
MAGVCDLNSYRLDGGSQLTTMRLYSQDEGLKLPYVRPMLPAPQLPGNPG